MKKTDVKNIAGGTKTTVTAPDGSKTITYNGVSNLHIGRTYSIPSSNTWKQQSSSSTNFSSTVKTGVTFKKVDSLHLNPKEINKMFSSHDHKTYATSNSSKDNQSEQSYPSSFKR